MAEPEGFCPACQHPLFFHTLRERRACRGAGIEVVPRPPTRLVLPEDIRVKVRKARRLVESNQPLPVDLRDAVREARRLRKAHAKEQRA